ncbi:MAG: SDR family oxidoreductase [Chloroflexi bacterium]|nr:MAG: SDR family oxidoreductase [Chloroflexota bacterium]
MELQGSTALVTGGGKRVGRALVLALAQAGCNLILHYNRSATDAEATAAEARRLGAQVILKQADLLDPEGARELVTAGEEGLPPAQILVNSAAIFPSDTLLDVTLDQWSRTFRVNLRAPVFLTQAFARRIRGRLPGAVINITDWRTARPYPDHFSYSVAKGALDAFTRAAAIALAPHIRVNAIALGAMLPPPDKDESYLQALAASLPLKRAGGVEVIAETMLFLLRNDFITGEIVRIDGGAHLQY